MPDPTDPPATAGASPPPCLRCNGHTRVGERHLGDTCPRCGGSGDEPPVVQPPADSPDARRLASLTTLFGALTRLPHQRSVPVSVADAEALLRLLDDRDRVAGERDRFASHVRGLEQTLRDDCDFEDELLKILAVRERVDDLDDSDQGRILETAKAAVAERDTLQARVAALEVDNARLKEELDAKEAWTQLAIKMLHEIRQAYMPGEIAELKAPAAIRRLTAARDALAARLAALAAAVKVCLPATEHSQTCSYNRHGEGCSCLRQSLVTAQDAAALLADAPVMPVSAAFEEQEIDGEDAALIRKMLADARTPVQPPRATSGVPLNSSAVASGGVAPATGEEF